MAGLNLVPNPTVLAIQTGIFLTALVVVKKLFLTPYLRIKERSEKATTGSQSAAASTTSENSNLGAKIEARLAEAAAQARQQAQTIKTKALHERDTYVTAAESDAKQTIGAMRKTIDDELKAEKGRVPAIVQQLSLIHI